MKRALSFWLACLLVLTALAGCAEESQLPGETDPGTENTAESTEDSQTTVAEPIPTENEYFCEGFEVDAKKYGYKEDDVLIFHVKNLVDVDYDIQLAVTFYDENNVETDHQEKYFKGFGANWENYFVFRTENPFARFRCAIEKMESTDMAYSAHLSQGTGEDALRFCVVEAKRWRSPEGELEFFDDWYLIVDADYMVLNDSDQDLYFSANFVLFDKNGEIFVIDAGVENRILGPKREFPESYVKRYVYRSEEPFPYDDVTGVLYEDRWNEEFRDKYNKEFSELLPEELRGDVTFIVSFLAVDDELILLD